MYNFEVEDWHTYIVSEQNVFVHNAEGYTSSNGAGNNGTSSTQQVEKISGSDIRHLNGALGEARGYNHALARGEIGIQAPGKITAPGPDYITFDPKT